MPQSTTEGKWILYSVSSGEQITRWPVDARGMLECGEFTADPPAGTEANAAPVSATLPSAPPLPPALPTEYAPGVPLVVTHAHEAEPSKPYTEPVRTKGRKAR